MQREINDLERRLEALRAASSGASSGGGMSAGAAAPAARRRGRPPGSGRGPGRPPGRPAGRPPGRPAAAAPAAAAAAPAAKGGRRRRGRTAITPEQLASRQLQGRYLGLIRQIPASRRAQYQRVAKERGREAAIREMQDTLKK
jgi:hypothetical protein